MRKLPTTRLIGAVAALLILIGGPAAMAQKASNNKGSPPGATNQPQNIPEAPIGHRQPRADQVPSEKNLGDPNDPLNKENAALDRKIKSICRGC
jgi:hypothetical protein